jgi:hypothetical protein
MRLTPQPRLTAQVRTKQLGLAGRRPITTVSLGPITIPQPLSADDIENPNRHYGEAHQEQNPKKYHPHAHTQMIAGDRARESRTLSKRLRTPRLFRQFHTRQQRQQSRRESLAGLEMDVQPMH